MQKPKPRCRQAQRDDLPWLRSSSGYWWLLVCLSYGSVTPSLLLFLLGILSGSLLPRASVIGIRMKLGFRVSSSRSFTNHLCEILYSNKVKFCVWSLEFLEGIMQPTTVESERHSQFEQFVYLFQTFFFPPHYLLFPLCMCKGFW